MADRGSPSMPAYRPKKVRRKSSAQKQGSPSMPSQRPVVRQRQERAATKAYKPPPSRAVKQGSPSVPAARSKARKVKERAATKRDAQMRKKYTWTKTAGGDTVRIKKSDLPKLKQQAAQRALGRRRLTAMGYGDDKLTPALRLGKDSATAGLSQEFSRRVAPATQAGLKILNETSRPIHGIAGAASAAQEGKDPVKGFKRGVQLKDRKLFSDVLRKAGVPGAAASVGGFALDVGLDPTTYLSAGSSIPVKAAAKGAEKKAATKFAELEARKGGDSFRASSGEARRAAESLKKDRKGNPVAVKPQKTSTSLVEQEFQRRVKKAKPQKPAQGESVEQAVQRQQGAIRKDVEQRFGAKPGEAVAKRAGKKAKGSPNRGITIGTKKHRTSGKGSARVAKAIGVPGLAKTVKESNLVQGVGEAASPGFVPAGVDREAFQSVRLAEAKGRASKDTAERQIGRKAKAYNDLPKPEQRQVIDAIEAGKVGKLKTDAPHLHAPAVRLRSDLRHMARKEKQAGLRSTTRSDYVPHLRRQDVEDLPNVIHGTPAKAKKGKGSTTLGSAKARKLEGSLAEWRKKDPSLFTDDAGQIYGQRAASSARALTNADIVKTVAKHGRRLSPKAHIDTAAEAVYRVTPSGLKKLEKDGKVDDKAISKALDGKANGQFVILSKRLGDDLLERQSPAKISPLRAKYRRVHGRYKTLLTQPMPSYHLRNLYGDTSNASYKQNVGELANNVRESGRGLREFRRIKKGEGDLTISGKPIKGPKGKTLKVRGKEVTHADELHLAQQHGGLSQGFSRELTEMMEKGEGKFRNFGQGRENLIRYATWLGARKQGLSPEKAGERVRELHFDYQDITDAQRAVRDFMPFATFAFKNTPLQAKTLVTHPGKLARYDKAMSEGAKAAGMDDNWRENLEEYQGLGLPIPVPGLGKNPMLGLAGLPTTDLNRLTLSPKDQTRQLASMVSGIKALVELNVSDEGYSFFFRGPIDSGHKVAAADWLHLVLPKDAQKKMGLEKAYDRASGKKIWKYDAKWDYALKQLPESSFLLGITSSGKNQRDQDKGLKAASLSGVKLEPYDPESKKMGDLAKQKKKLRNRMLQLNDQGVYADTGNAEYTRVSEKLKKLEGSSDKILLKRKKAGEPVRLPRRLEKGSAGTGSTADDYKKFQAQKKNPTVADDYKKFLKER